MRGAELPRIGRTCRLAGKQWPLDGVAIDGKQAKAFVVITHERTA